MFFSTFRPCCQVRYVVLLYCYQVRGIYITLSYPSYLFNSTYPLFLSASGGGMFLLQHRGLSTNRRLNSTNTVESSLLPFSPILLVMLPTYNLLPTSSFIWFPRLFLLALPTTLP